MATFGAADSGVDAMTATRTWPTVAERLIRALRIPGVEVSALADFL